MCLCVWRERSYNTLPLWHLANREHAHRTLIQSTSMFPVLQSSNGRFNTLYCTAVTLTYPNPVMLTESHGMLLTNTPITYHRDITFALKYLLPMSQQQHQSEGTGELYNYLCCPLHVRQTMSSNWFPTQFKTSVCNKIHLNVYVIMERRHSHLHIYI